MKYGFVKVLCLMAAFGCAASVDAGESGGVTRPPSIPTGNIYQGYHPLGINVYTSYWAQYGTLSVVLNDYPSISSLGDAHSSPSPVVSLPASTQGVPEPSTAVLGAVATAFIAAFRRRRRD